LSKQYYFVVFYDTETGEWNSDPEREDAVFHDDRVWDTETEEWERGEFGEGTEADEVATKLNDLLMRG
jgi:hypothetical protein